MGSVKNRSIAVGVAFLGAAVVAALLKFNPAATSYNQYVVGNLIGLLLAPLLMVFLVFRAEPSDFGFTLGSSKRAWLVSGVLFAGLLVAMFVASKWQSFQSYYPLFRHYPEFWQAFAKYPEVSPFTAAPMLMLYAELSYGLYMLGWEFFFRGFLLFGLSRSIGWWAVLVQALAFGLMHHGKPPVEVAVSFGSGIVLGMIALSAKSFVPCFVLHWAASVSFDLLVVAARPHP